jgi:hypothetical protein
VEIRAYAERIEIRQDGRVVGEHPRSFGRDRTISDLWHYVPPVRMHHRIAHPRAQQTGLTAQEFEPDGKAADEIQRLWVYARMNLWSSKHAAAA